MGCTIVAAALGGAVREIGVEVVDEVDATGVPDHQLSLAGLWDEALPGSLCFQAITWIDRGS